MQAVDATKSISDRASELMRAYAQSFSPRSYEIWYTYVTGLNPGLNEAVKRLIVAQETLRREDIDALYEEHFASYRLAAQAERSGSGLSIEIEQVLGLIEGAVGSTERYGASLAALTGDLHGPDAGGRMLGVVEALISATRDVASSNGALERRLKESRGEIEALRQRLDEVRVESLTDPLTGIANRKHFESALAGGVATALAERSPLTLIVIDIDQFKRFNDTYGHLTGDQVLGLIAGAMREAVQDGSTLARFGGEEFGIILPGSDHGQAFECAERIRLGVMSRELMKRSTGESLGRVTVSLGIASLKPDDTATSLLERADLCMYRAKQAGRNRAVSDRDLADVLPHAA